MTPYAGPTDGTIKGACQSCHDPDDDEECGPCVEEARMAWACRCTCTDLGFQAIPTTAPSEDCNCTTGITAPGATVIGALIGWCELSDSLMDELKAAAKIRSGSEDVKLRLYGNGMTGGPETRCNVGIEGWTPLPLNEAGDMALINPAGGRIVDGTGGATTLTAEQLGIEIDPVEGGTGTDCATTGGHRKFKAVFSTVGGGGESGEDDIFLVECKFDGVTGTPACDTQKCCDWGLSDGPNILSPGRVEATYTRPPDCVCVPGATVTIDDGVNTPEVHPLLISPALIAYDNPDWESGMVIRFTLDQAYTECAEDCTNPSPSESSVTL